VEVIAAVGPIISTLCPGTERWRAEGLAVCAAAWCANKAAPAMPNAHAAANAVRLTVDVCFTEDVEVMGRSL
jgi:hypothetical protein